MQLRKKILIIDDEIDVVKFLEARLKRNNFDVVWAQDGVTGLEKSLREKPNLILLDIAMPGKDGLELLKELKSNKSTQKIPVIMVTAKSHTNYIFKGQSLGADDYIIKPYTFDYLLRYIKKYIEKSEDIYI